MVAVRIGAGAVRAPLLVGLVLLGFLDALGPLSIDLYLPAFPDLQRDLHLTDAGAQATLAAMTLGMALGQSFVGAWSDRVGRRMPLLLSGALHAAATTACVLAPSGAVLTCFRFAQGVGAAGCAVVVLAIVRDISTGPDFVVMLSRVTLITTTAPLLAHWTPWVKPAPIRGAGERRLRRRFVDDIADAHRWAGCRWVVRASFPSLGG